MLRALLLGLAVACVAAGETHRFEPTEFHNTFSFAHKPVLRVKPGDRIITKTIDARGFDEHNEKHGERPNPQTGPFYIEGAEPGDVLVVIIEKLEPNRDTGWSSTLLAPYTADPDFLRAEGQREQTTVTWRIDKARGVARAEGTGSRPATIEIPLRPMLGCVGVAPARKEAIATSTPDTFGGNMDYNGMGAGVRLMLPVREPGALLFFGDGHAAQGDGEVLGNAVETSLSVELRVELLKNKAIAWPRFETAEHIGVLGSARPLMQALQHATTELQRWLMADYGFDERGSSMLLGQAMQIDVANVVDPHFTAVAKIRKSLLRGAAPQAAALQPPIQPKAEEIQRFREKTQDLLAEVTKLRSARRDDALVDDVEAYLKAGQMLLEFPDEFYTQEGINNAFGVLETGLERAHQLAAGHSPWMSGQRRTHGYRSAVDGSIQPYGIMLPDRYDASKPARLYVWMHGRANRLTEADFLHSFMRKGPARPPVADAGQIQLEVYGRRNGAGYHWAGEADVFEAIAAVQKRYKIDPDRIVLRGFSMGGEGAWHIALHHPDRFVAAEIGAGTISRRAEAVPNLTDYQLKTLRIWENMTEWALNAFNLPIAGHDGDADNQVCCIPPFPPGVKNHGQLESSLRVRGQLAKEGFPLEGDPDFLRAKGTPSIFLISQNTGHGTSPLVRERLDAFLKQQADRGRVSPDHVRFITWTTRYNRDYWISVDGLAKHYERSTADAERLDGRSRYRIATANITRLTLRETDAARKLEIDGQTLAVKPAREIALEKGPSGWKVATARISGLRKTHGLQGPIEDAFLEPFLCVRPTGKPWNEAVNRQALQALERFDRLHARWLRGHPRIVDDTDVTESDFARYNVVLFGDPGSNKWIARLQSKLPVRWTRESVSLAGASYPAASHYPALIYPSPLAKNKYIVLNTGLTISEREYNGDYGMPRYADWAVLKVANGPLPDVVESAAAGLFDESWK